MEIKTVEMVRRIRDENYEQTKNLSFEERKAFYRKKSEEVMRKSKILLRSKKEKLI